MKKIFVLLLLLNFYQLSHAQIWKIITQEAKNAAENKVRSKVYEKTYEVLDSIDSKSKSKKNKQNKKEKSDAGNKRQEEVENNSNGPSNSNTGQQGGGTQTGEGFIDLHLSAPEIFTNGTVTLSGASIKYGALKDVEIRISGPDNDQLTLPLSDKGEFNKAWKAKESGEYTITAFSSDRKAQTTQSLSVKDIEIGDWNANTEEINRARDKLLRESDRVKENIAQKDKAELDRRLNEVKQKINEVLEFMEELNAARKKLGEMAANGVPIPEKLPTELSKLNDHLWQQREQMKQMNDAADHEPFDNTICEYLVMLNEACAAFATFTGPWFKVGMAILNSITPLSNEGIAPQSSSYGALAKTPGKVFLTSKFKAEKLASRLGAAKFAADIMQYASDYLLKKYCGILQGSLSHNYRVSFRNSLGQPWWEYNYLTQAAVTLRYPKNASGGGIVRMKGNIEGNATAITFYEDVELEEEFRQAMKSRARVIHVKLYEPVVMPFASSQNDKVGFGALARALATPAYFNIPIDAEYNMDAGTIKIFLNEAIIDFTPMVKFIYGFVAIAVGIPLVTRVDFPIYKARLTLNAVMSQNNQFKVTENPEKGISFSGDGNREIGSETSPIWHKIHFTISAKSIK